MKITMTYTTHLKHYYEDVAAPGRADRQMVVLEGVTRESNLAASIGWVYVSLLCSGLYLTYIQIRMGTLCLSPLTLDARGWYLSPCISVWQQPIKLKRPS